MTEKQRQLKKISIIIIIIFFVVIVIYLIIPRKEDTCFNGMHDIDEDDIDCGGTCLKECAFPLKPPLVNDITIGWTRLIKDGQDNYDFVVKLSNKNEKWGLSLVSYIFTVYDKDDNVIGTKTGETYIMPRGFLENTGEKYLIEDNYKTNEKIEKISFELYDFYWTEVESKERLPEVSEKIIIITNKDYGFTKAEDEFYYAFGVTKNTSIYNFRFIDIKVILFDKKDEPIAVAKTDQWTIEAGKGWEFKVFWRNPFSGEVDYVEYEAETNVFNLSNFMRIYGTGEEYTIPR